MALPLLLLGAFSLLLLVPYALLTWIAVASDPETISTAADQARDTQSRESAAHLFQLVAPALLICGLVLMLAAVVLFFTPLRPAGPEDKPPRPRKS
jgi:uncharacterized membrane protein YphA (DoxX/SURF4 family)